MNDPGVRATFAGNIPQLYEEYLVPLIFEPYATDLGSRVASCQPSRVLEIAAGTGVVTRQLAKNLPAGVSIVATDLSQAMLDQAAAVGVARAVEWRQADALQMPFPDEAFDAVVCQFGVMFFPDKARAFSEARRVLRPGGRFMFNVWDSIDKNEFADAVTSALEVLFPNDPPRFLARIPHGYHDPAVIERDLAQGGFTKPPNVVTMTARSRASTARVPAVAYCQGTPLRSEIEALGASRLAEATDKAADAMARQFGPGPVDGKIQALVIAAERQ
ncbi:class I SAM-dependent methyltransferase [Noviherbaspirillum malthae]|uniref:class I SAM-dependent methyltransferase n=1 Tax=Noviherbaspirillum malthae TaxID=1260987 RepID=UPI00188F845B|nr:class I SAM-dependent methyltransferase [Noviherbaspirillum malthae]